MAYWGNKADECDYAFDTLGSYVAHARDSMFHAAEGTITEKYPEQTILVTLKAIRVLWGAFPKNIACTFHRGDLDKSKRLFNEWLDAAGPKLPKARRIALLAEAQSIFEACEDMYR